MDLKDCNPTIIVGLQSFIYFGHMMYYFTLHSVQLIYKIQIHSSTVIPYQPKRYSVDPLINHSFHLDHCYPDKIYSMFNIFHNLFYNCFWARDLILRELLKTPFKSYVMFLENRYVTHITRLVQKVLTLKQKGEQGWTFLWWQHKTTPDKTRKIWISLLVF